MEAECHSRKDTADVPLLSREDTADIPLLTRELPAAKANPARTA